MNMQDKKGSKPMQISQFGNGLIIDMKTLSNSLNSLSKNLYQNNNRILNELLMAKQQRKYELITAVLVHALQIIHYKQLTCNVLVILNKAIVYTKSLTSVELKQQQKQSMRGIVGCIADVLMAATTQHKQNQQISLRIIQSAFSLIQHSLIAHFQITTYTKIFSILFQYCKGVSIIQNISVSALFALVEGTFQFGGRKQAFQVLTSFLKYLFDAKKYVWIKGADLNGLVWDLAVVGIKNFNSNHIIVLDSQTQCKTMINKMYEIVTQCIFLKKKKDFYNSPPESIKQASNTKNQNQKNYEEVSDYLRYFKAYVAISASLSIQSFRILDKQYVPFRSTIPKLTIISDLQRNSRMYIFLEAICQLLLDQYDIPLSLQKGPVFMEILSKISEQICLQNENIKVNWENSQNYLQKIVNQQPKITDGDFVRLIKNTIINLRMKFQKDDDLIKCKKLTKQLKQSSRSMTSSAHLPQSMGNTKKWQIFIKNVIRIVRYLSSLNFINDENEEDPTRKFILQLQYWFLICPISKAKNMVLQELLITANVLNNKMQAVKVSQSVQIGSNILYGYYQDLDSTGLTIILKMMAGIKADWEEGKSFQQLDQIYNLCSNIFSQEKLIKNQNAFTMTIQALVQCANSLIADIQQPKQKSSGPQNNQNSLKRLYKMIDYLIQRLIIVINNSPGKAVTQWNFITAFFITLCFHKNIKIKQQGIKYIGSLVRSLLKSQLGEQLDKKKEIDIMELYLELSKAQIKQIQLNIIDQIKGLIPRVKQQAALMDGFRIVKIFSQNQKASKDFIASLHELQQILIKQCLYRITQTKYLKLILEGMQIKSSEKNQQYRLINLYWSIADYFRKITPEKNIQNQYLQLWETLFKSIWTICQSTRECETKQSAIHAMTQILAESCSLLPFDFIILIISKYYHQMVLLLIGIHASSLTDAQKSPETAKVALKNYIKIFKKLICIQNKTQQHKKQIEKNLSGINSSITQNLQKHIQSKNTGNITIQLIYQLGNFISLVTQDKGFYQYGIKKDLRQMFNAIENLIKLSEQGPQNPKMDLKSHMYKKKLKPLLDKIRQAQDEQKKQQVVVQGNIQITQKQEAEQK